MIHQLRFDQSLLRNTTRLRQIRSLPCSTNVNIYKEFLTMGWCRNDFQQFSYKGVSLQHFSTFDLSSPNLSKIILSEALQNFEYFLIFCFGEVYKEVTKTLWEDIQYGECAKPKYSTEFVRHQIEFMLSTVFQIIKDTSYLSITTHDITESTGVKKFLQDRLTSVINNVTIEKQLIFFTTRNASLTLPFQSSAVVVTGLPTVTTASTCKYFFFNQLGVTDRQNKVITCTQQNCKFPHSPLSAITETEAKGFITTWQSVRNKSGKPILSKPLLDKVNKQVAHAVQTKSFKP